ncbi:MAG: polysaccharide pyruvyl transferase family protein [Agarilytica sp.]
MDKFRVLHVASFSGNIGDNANHTGFRESFDRHIGVEVEYTEFEIREVFWKRKKFDSSFVVLANSYDLVVIGGGNYFELWVDDSATGTSIDIDLDLLKNIRTPIVFNALGVDPAQGAKDESVKKFRCFLDYAISSPTIILSCRNDGSIKALREIVGEKYADAFYHVPDSGLFTVVKNTYHPEIEPRKKNVVIQVAGDMLETRFPADASESISADEFLNLMARYIENINELDVNFIFVPHIFRDIGVISDLLNLLPDDIRRRNVAVAPYLVGQKGQDYIFDLYKKSDLVLGMRFHANVCGLGLGKTCIGLVNYRQIDELYNELGLEEYKIQVNQKGFDKKLFDLSVKILNDSVFIKEDVLPFWREKLDMFHADIARWLKS